MKKIIINKEKYRKINDFLELKCISLMKHECKQSEQVRFPISNFAFCQPSADLIYCSISTNTFLTVINEGLLSIAMKENPCKFGTKNAKDVISALLESSKNVLPGIYENYKESLDDYSDFLKKAHTYIVEESNNELNSEILRIDLFRKIKENGDGDSNFDFIGGLFHAFKHFSIDKINLSTGSEKVELIYPSRIIDFGIKAFFQNERVKTNSGFNSEVSFDDNHNLLFSFYYEKVTKVYFINTIRKNKKKKTISNQANKPIGKIHTTKHISHIL